MPECRCLTEAADYRKKFWCQTNFSPAFQHLHVNSISYSKNNSITSCLRTCRVYHLPLPAFWTCTGSLSPPPPTAFLNARMSDCPASSQPGNGMNKNSDAGTSPLLEFFSTGLRYMMPECRCRCPAMHSCEIVSLISVKIFRSGPWPPSV